MIVGKLGKKAPRVDSRTLKLSNYLAKPSTTLPRPPAEVSWVTKVPSWPMYLNDSLGDCVIAAMGHMIEQWSFYATGTEVSVTNNQVLSAYEILGGYVPNNPETDNGVDMLSALQWWKRTGFAGHKILAYMSVDWTNLTEVFQAIQLFGNVFLGVALPVTAQGQNGWTVAQGGPDNNPNAAPGTWGGHCIPLMAASPETLTCITWGERLKMSHNFLKDYGEEAYVVLSPDWFSKLGASPGNFDLNQLTADLAAL